MSPIDRGSFARSPAPDWSAAAWPPEASALDPAAERSTLRAPQAGAAAPAHPRTSTPPGVVLSALPSWSFADFSRHWPSTFGGRLLDNRLITASLAADNGGEGNAQRPGTPPRTDAYRAIEPGRDLGPGLKLLRSERTGLRTVRRQEWQIHWLAGNVADGLALERLRLLAEFTNTRDHQRPSVVIKINGVRGGALQRGQAMGRGRARRFRGSAVRMSRA